MELPQSLAPDGSGMKDRQSAGQACEKWTDKVDHLRICLPMIARQSGNGIAFDELHSVVVSIGGIHGFGINMPDPTSNPGNPDHPNEGWFEHVDDDPGQGRSVR